MSAYSLIINLFSVASWMRPVLGLDMKPFIISVVAIMLIASAASLSFVLNPGFGQVPQGAEKSQIERSPNYRDGAFHNSLPTPGFTSDKNMLMAWWEFLTAKRENARPSRPLPLVATDLA